MNDMSKTIFQWFEKTCGLNMQLARDFIEETALASKEILTSERHADVLAALVSLAQPMA